MRRIIGYTVRVVDGLSGLFGIAAVLATFTACGFVVYDVAMRQAGMPQPYMYNLIMIVTIWAIYLGVPFTHMRDQHVKIDVILLALPARGQTAIRILGELVTVAVLMVVVWSAFKQWELAWRFQSRMVGQGRFLIWVPQLVIVLALAMMAVQALANILRILAPKRG